MVVHYSVDYLQDMTAVDLGKFDIQDASCFTVSAFKKRMKIHDVISLLRLALKVANKQTGQVRPVSVLLVADEGSASSAGSFHIAFSRDLTPAETECVCFQLSRECEVLGKYAKNRLKHGIHDASNYLFHDGHNLFFTKTLFH